MKKNKIYVLILTSLLSLSACGSNEGENGNISVTLNISKNEILFPISGGNESITVSSNVEWRAYASESWISVTPESGVSGTNTISIKATENTIAGDARTATVTIKNTKYNKTAIVSITQEAPEKTESDIKCPIGDEYKLVWHDEFNTGSQPGPDWTFAQGYGTNGWGNNELQYYTHGEILGTKVTEVVDGHLNITCFKASDKKIYSARMYAKETKGWKYCYIEASIKLPKGKGTWPAFWMMPANNNYSTNPWPGCGENDIMEEVGYRPNYVSSTIHCNAYNNGGTSIEHYEKYLAGAQDEFHVYACEWTEDYIQYYVDGVKTLKYQPANKNKNNWPFNYAFYPILNLAWGGSWGGAQGVDETALPTTMQVDYIRVFQK